MKRLAIVILVHRNDGGQDGRMMTTDFLSRPLGQTERGAEVPIVVLTSGPFMAIKEPLPDLLDLFQFSTLEKLFLDLKHAMDGEGPRLPLDSYLHWLNLAGPEQDGVILFHRFVPPEISTTRDADNYRKLRMLVQTLIYKAVRRELTAHQEIALALIAGIYSAQFEREGLQPEKYLPGDVDVEYARMLAQTRPDLMSERALQVLSAA